MATNFSSNETVLFFNGLHEKRISKTLGLVIGSTLPVVICLSATGVIWFERFGSDLKRIFINRAVSSICWNILAYFAFIHLPEIFLYFGQPFPEWFCFFHLVLRNVIVIQIVLWMDVIAIVRYIFIFWLKNPLSFQDNFWSCFINRWMAISWFRLFCLFGILCLFS